MLNLSIFYILLILATSFITLGYTSVIDYIYTSYSGIDKYIYARMGIVITFQVLFFISQIVIIKIQTKNKFIKIVSCIVLSLVVLTAIILTYHIYKKGHSYIVYMNFFAFIFSALTFAAFIRDKYEEVKQLMQKPYGLKTIILSWISATIIYFSIVKNDVSKIGTEGLSLFIFGLGFFLLSLEAAIESFGKEKEIDK